MKNFVQPGDTITCPAAPRALSAGDGCLSGALFGVALGTAASGAEVELLTRGVVDLPALGTDTPAFGALAYWDNTNFRLTTTSAGNRLVGNFVLAKANGVTTGRVRLDGAAR